MLGQGRVRGRCCHCHPPSATAAATFTAVTSTTHHHRYKPYLSAPCWECMDPLLWSAAAEAGNTLLEPPPADAAAVPIPRPVAMRWKKALVVVEAPPELEGLLGKVINCTGRSCSQLL
jgi:hypothetical protein